MSLCLAKLSRNGTWSCWTDECENRDAGFKAGAAGAVQRRVTAGRIDRSANTDRVVLHPLQLRDSQTRQGDVDFACVGCGEQSARIHIRRAHELRAR